MPATFLGTSPLVAAFTTAQMVHHARLLVPLGYPSSQTGVAVEGFKCYNSGKDCLGGSSFHLRYFSSQGVCCSLLIVQAVSLLWSHIAVAVFLVPSAFQIYVFDTCRLFLSGFRFQPQPLGARRDRGHRGCPSDNVRNGFVTGARGARGRVKDRECMHEGARCRTWPLSWRWDMCLLGQGREAGKKGCRKDEPNKGRKEGSKEARQRSRCMFKNMRCLRVSTTLFWRESGGREPSQHSWPRGKHDADCFFSPLRPTPGRRNKCTTGGGGIVYFDVAVVSGGGMEASRPLHCEFLTSRTCGVGEQPNLRGSCHWIGFGTLVYGRQGFR